MTEQLKTKASMAYEYGSKEGVVCWCGNQSASGLTHQKVFHPVSCDSEKCKELQAEYDRLPDGDESEWASVFGG